MEETILTQCLERLRALDVTVDDIVASKDIGPVDYTASIEELKVVVLCKKNITKQNYGSVLMEVRKASQTTSNPIIVFTANISPDLMKALGDEGVSVMETSGNCQIKIGKVIIKVSGNKKCPLPNDERQAMTPVRLKIIFFLLLDPENVNLPLRAIANATGGSLGTVKYVLDDLTQKRFVLHTPKKRILRDRRKLLDLWQVLYNQTLKPKQLINTYDFAKSEDRCNWKEIVWPKGIIWGGEAAANIIDNYLIPEEFELYSSLPGMKLLATGKLRPSPTGKIKVYKSFWPEDKTDLAAPLLAYADLMGSRDSRNIEAAQRLLEKLNLD